MRSHGDNPRADPAHHDYVHMTGDFDAICRAVGDEFGRKPTDCGILWSVRIQVADSEAQAKAMEEHYLDSIPPEAGLIGLLALKYS